MPELPEVETIKRQLAKKIKGKTIRKVDVFLPKLVKFPLEKFKVAVSGKKIESVNRRAKQLIIGLSGENVLVIHLKMSGQLIFNGEKGKHTHLIYYFTDGTRLIHNDTRQFGFVKLIPKKDLLKYFEKENYGPEPLSKSFTLALFKRLLDKKKKKIKPLLMDQTFVAGIGNLYADEILFFAKVLPTRETNKLSDEEVRKIYEGIKKVLNLAVRKHGSSADAYVDTAGKKGKFFPASIMVYRREKQPCLKCQTEIKRVKIGSRSAYFCPQCQK